MQVFDGATTGMHMQIGKGGGYHYFEAERRGEALPICVLLGGDPALMLASIAPLPEDTDEFALAAYLRGAPLPVVRAKTNAHLVPASCEFVFEGRVPPERVAAVCQALIEMGAFQVSVSDTIGVAHPGQIPVVVDAVAARVPLDMMALHFHDTRGTALANVLTALQMGVTTFDSSAGGLGGCPYAPGATGNLATEDLIYMLDGLGIETGVNLGAVLDASAYIESRVGHRLPSRYYRAARSV